MSWRGTQKQSVGWPLHGKVGGMVVAVVRMWCTCLLLAGGWWGECGIYNVHVYVLAGGWWLLWGECINMSTCWGRGILEGVSDFPLFW